LKLSGLCYGEVKEVLSTVEENNNKDTTDDASSPMMYSPIWRGNKYDSEESDERYVGELEDSTMPRPVKQITSKYFPNLEKVIIKNNHDLISVYDLPKLSLIDLEDCQSLQHIGQSKRICSSLKTLKLSHCNRLHHKLDPEGTHKKLEILWLQDMTTPVISTIGTFLYLKELVVKDCPQLEEIECLPQLKYLNLENCPQLRLGGITNDKFPNLASLEFKNIATLTIISNCYKLRNVNIRFDHMDDHSFNMLRGVIRCPILTQLTIYPPKRSLIVKECPRLAGWNARY